MSATLISGERGAVLVDAFMAVDQARGLADWVAARGKTLTTIYATHGHGDHFFRAATILEQFPSARFVATPGVVKIMREQTSPQFLASFGAPGMYSDEQIAGWEKITNCVHATRESSKSGLPMFGEKSGEAANSAGQG